MGTGGEDPPGGGLDGDLGPLAMAKKVLDGVGSEVASGAQSSQARPGKRHVEVGAHLLEFCQRRSAQLRQIAPSPQGAIGAMPGAVVEVEPLP